MRATWGLVVIGSVACNGGNAPAPSASTSAASATPSSATSASASSPASSIAVALPPLKGPKVAAKPRPPSSLWVGERQACAKVRADVRCWGYNAGGNLGLPLAKNDKCGVGKGCRTKPEVVPAFAGFVDLGLTETTTCGIDEKGGVSCLGAGTFVTEPGPDLVECPTTGNKCRLKPLAFAMPEASALAVGQHNACALTRRGDVWCWGSSRYGALGGGSPVTCDELEPCLAKPSQVVGITGAVQLARGTQHTCALIRDGGVRCWGSAEMGQLGDGTQGERCGSGTLPSRCRWAPSKVAGLDDAVAISAGSAHTCAVRSDATVVCWGYDVHHQLGNASASDDKCGESGGSPCALAPRLVEGITDAVDVRASLYGNCVLKKDGAVWCWGLGFGEHDLLGEESPVPTKVEGLGKATELGVGASSACAVVDGGVVCWGANGFATLGDGTLVKRMTPAPIAR